MEGRHGRTAAFWTIAALAGFLLVGLSTSLSAANVRVLKERCLKVTYQDREAVVGEFTLIEKLLKASSSENAKELLRQRLLNTRWGSPERAVACYVSAWYGADYNRSRDYLLNCFFWDHREGQASPYCWAEDTVDLLYELYEHNHDFQLLHDLVTGTSDGAGTDYLVDITSKACAKHPRGILHVASISKAGLTRVRMIVHQHEDEFEFDRKSVSILRTYARRVEADRNDPLRGTAQRVLK